MIEYKILNTYRKNLEYEVSHFLNLGWVCQGGVCVVDSNRGKQIFSQAMIKAAQTEKEE